MSPLPLRFADRWRAGRPGPSYDDSVCWHLLLGADPEVQMVAAEARRRLERFSDLSMTPVRWLHVTVLLAGAVESFTESDMDRMLASAQADLADIAPVAIRLGRVFYHPEAITLPVIPADALNPLFEAAQAATREVIGTNGNAGDPQWWLPHVTLCYSTREQPAAPVIAALGKELPSCEFTIDRLSLVVQHGSEQDWDWRVAGTARLLGG